MKRRMQEILDCMHRYNAPNMAFQAFGLDSSIEYDLLVVAPSFTPEKIGIDKYCDVYKLKENPYTAGYCVEYEGHRIAWIQTASGDGNLIDYLSICAELKFRRMVFIGAVGALKPSFQLGEICTPSYCIAGGAAHFYLNSDFKDFRPFDTVSPDMDSVDSLLDMVKGVGVEVKKASVFCTPTIALEYLQLDGIRGFGTDLIEMETAAFYKMADLIEKPAIALLVVSDNSSSGEALVGRTEEQQKRYEKGKKEVLPKMVLALAKGEK